jgi:hypothetical protein
MSSPTELDKQAADLRWLNKRLGQVFVTLVTEIRSENFNKVEAIALADAIRALAATGELSSDDVLTELWEPCQLGGFKIGDTVRVREDAYPEVAGGNTHNGKRGSIVAVRNGVLHIRYIGDKGTGMASTNAHRPEALQVLKTGTLR